MKAMADALAAAEARAKDEAAARARMEAEIRARAEAERKAREEAEARARAAEEAVTKARAMAEQAARAQAEAEARALAQTGSDAEAQVKVAAAMQALEEARQRARQEADARAAAEARAREEAATRQRDEAERKTLDEAQRKERDEAEAHAYARMKALKEQARRASEEAERRAEAERKERAEAAAKIEAERKAHEAAMRKAQEEAARKAREEAAASIEAARKAREEAEALADAERKARAEAVRKAQEETERRTREESAAEIDAARKAREEAEARVETERRAREEAERRAQQEVAAKIDAEKRAREEAERQAELARRAREEAEHRAREARTEAEERAKQEAVARVLQEQQMRANAENEVKTQVAAELKAKERAEMEADARYRAEIEERARSAAAERMKQPQAEANGGRVPEPRKRTNWVKLGGMSAIALLALGIGLLHVVPLTGYVPAVQELMAQRLGQPVQIGDLRYALLPAPQLTLKRVVIGRFEDVKAGNIVVSGSPFAFMGGERSFDRVEANGVSIEQDALATMASWVKPQQGAQPLQVGRVRLNGVRLRVKDFEVPPFEADITLARNGTLQKASLTGGKVRIDVAPMDQGFQMNLDARGWALPLLPAIEFNDLSITAVFGRQDATVTRFEGNLGAGKLKGDGKIEWGSGMRMRGTFALSNGSLSQVLAAFTREFTASGTLSANGSYSMEGNTLAALVSGARVEASFKIEKGALNNVDLVRAIQSPSRDGVRGGRTHFTVFAGSLRAGGKQYSYRRLNLDSGQFSATGNVDVAPDGELSGRVSAEIGSKSVIVARGTLDVSGNLKTPVLKP